MLILALGISGQACAKTGMWSSMGETSSIEISPAQPTSSDEVYVTVSRVVPSSGYSVEITEVCIEGDQIWLAVITHRPGPGIQSQQAFTWRDHTRSLGQLGPGTYTVYVGDYATGSYDDSLSFTVTNAGSDVLDDGAGTHTEGFSNCICQRWPALFAGRPCPFCGRDSSDPSDSGNAGSLLDGLRQRLGIFWQK